MPQALHVERHSTGGERVRDVVIGMSDRLTVSFAQAAGLSGAVSSTSIIVTAGLAEIAAGSIAMGLGGYLTARSDVGHSASERRREETEVREKPDAQRALTSALTIAGACIAGGFIPQRPTSAALPSVVRRPDFDPAVLDSWLARFVALEKQVWSKAIRR